MPCLATSSRVDLACSLFARERVLACNRRLRNLCHRFLVTEDMKIVIIGANSAVGQAILRWEWQHGTGADAIIAAVRSERAAEQIRPLLNKLDNRISEARITYDDPDTLDVAFQGASAVIHLAGILVERPGSTYEEANVVSARSVLEAAKRCGVEKFVMVSALGADETSSNRYYRTKGQAEALVRGSGLCYTILRAPLLLGPGTEGSVALRRNAKGPKAKLIGGGRNLQQPLHVDDLARAAIIAIQPSLASNRILNLVGPVSLPERELVERAAQLQGHNVQIRSISKGLLSVVLTLRQRFAGPGFSRDALEVITADTHLDPQPAATELGISLTGIEQMIKDSLGQ